MKTKARIATRTTRATRSPVPVRRPMPSAPPLTRAELQPTLTVGAVNDPAEREAETMAARVVGASAPAPVAAPVAAPTATQGKGAALTLPRSAADQPNLDELVPEPAPAEQQDFELPATNDVPMDALSPADMAELESGEPAATDGETVQAAKLPGAAVGRMGGAAPADVSRHVASPGPGRPLPSGLRARVEPHFGTSFEDVRLHDGPADQDAAARIGARAFTHKNRIWLGRGESPTNTRLMAHELSHVVQQTQGSEALPLRREPVIRREEDAPEAGGWGSDAIEALARYAPGYTLITVIMGRTLFSGVRVIKNATNLLGGLFGLHPLGTVLFDKLRETRMVEEAFQWVQTRLSDLNLTWSRLRGVISRVLSPPLVGARQYVIDQFAPLLSDIRSFVVDVGKKVLEFAVRGALRLAGPLADRIWAIFQQAGDVLSLIAENPLAFAMNLVRAVVGGFRKFGTNILEHLKKGLLGWLFGAIAGAGITLPARFDFKGIMSLVMQILGLTYANFRRLLVRRLGPRGERMVSMIETSVEIVKVLLREGFAGIWQKMLEMMENFKARVIGGISQMVIGTIVEAGIGWLAGLSNPVGAVVRVVKAIYDMIKTFLERLEQIMAVAQSIFSSIGAIARGQVEGAAAYIEQVIGRSVPVVISFLAALLGLGGISGRIRNVITAIQRPVLNAMDRVIAFVIKKAKQLFSRIIARLNQRRRLPSVPFQVGATPHELRMVRDGRKVKYMIASETPHEKDPTATATTEAANELPETEHKPAVVATAAKVAALAQAMEPHENINTQSQNQATRGPVDRSVQAATARAGEVTAASTALAQSPAVTTETSENDPALFRLKVDRVEAYEANFGTYAELNTQKQTLLNGLPEDLRSRYASDHVIEKAFPKHILLRLEDLNRRRAGRDATVRALPGGRITQGPVTERTGRAPNFGLIGDNRSQYFEIGDNADQFPAVATYMPSHRRVNADGVGAARTLVARAIESDDPHQTLRDALSAQLQAERQSMLDAVSGDPDAPAWLAAKTDAALAYVERENMRIYRLAAGSQTPVDRTPGRAVPPNDTRMYMDGRGNGPAFRDVEGVGGGYGADLPTQQGFLERDHVLEQAHVTSLKTLPLLTPSHQTSLLARLRGSSSALALSAAQQSRLETLQSANLFHPSSRVGQYDGSGPTGFAIPLEYGLAQRVSAANRGRALDLTRPDIGGRTLDQLAQFVLNGKRGDYRKAVRHMQGPIRRAMLASTQQHGDTILAEYARAPNEVRAANPGNEDAALEDLRQIQGNVRTSLGRARTATAHLFTTPIVPE